MLKCLPAEAVTFGEDRCYYWRAWPGKTFTITQRILYLIRNAGSPREASGDHVYQRSGSIHEAALLQRSSSGLHTVNFGTFHSVFYQILLQSGRISSGQYFKRKTKRDLILPILKKKQTVKKIRSGSNGACQNYLDAIGYYKNTGDIENSRKKSRKKKNNIFPDIWGI